MTADATLPGGLGSFGWDDEGVAAVRADLVEGGVLRAALSNRESAAAVGLERVRRLRARRRLRPPADRAHDQRLAGARERPATLADLIADTDEGLYLETNRSWSIDDRRLQFQFATEVCREIRGGELGRLLPQRVLRRRDARSSGARSTRSAARDEWRLWGLTNCGKGEPGQIMRVSHGAAPARFRDVQVGVA